MFPFFRVAKELFRAKRLPPLENFGDEHISHHICWPQDLDMWLELNNGRTLTLYDIGRIAMAYRGGLIPALRKNRWGLTMAGSYTRFRRRIRGFERFEMRSRLVCFDIRFMYIEQSMWKTNGDCASHVVYRAAVTDKDGIVAPAQAMQAMGHTGASPEMPAWIAAWCAAEDKRPWPPMQD